MLEALVITGIVAAPLGSAALFLPARQHRHVAGTWAVLRRFALAVIGTVVLAAAAAAILKLLSASGSNLTAGVAGVVVASAAWLPVTRRWSPRAHLCWASTTFHVAPGDQPVRDAHHDIRHDGDRPMRSPPAVVTGLSRVRGAASRFTRTGPWCLRGRSWPPAQDGVHEQAEHAVKLLAAAG